MRKQVVIHIGYHKTGSSALQAAFALNADRLRTLGISYPCPDQAPTIAGGVCSGNIVQLLYKNGFMEGVNARSQKAAACATPLFFEHLNDVVINQHEPCVLFSGEVLGNLSESQLAMLQKYLDGSHDLRIICYVRDPFDFAYSSWKQRAKGGNLTEDFEAYILSNDLTTVGLSMLRQFPILSRSGLNVTVLRYETHRKAIAEGFMAALGWMTPEDCAAFSAPQEANPSINGVHALMATQLRAAAPDSALAELYVQHVLSYAPATRDAYYNRRLHRMILDRFGGAIETINSYLEPDEQLSTSERETGDVDLVQSTADIRLVAEALKFYLELREPDKSQRNLINRLIHKFRWPQLSTRFNPQAYLFLNPDVAGCGISPQEHYLAHGRAEGRQILDYS